MCRESVGTGLIRVAAPVQCGAAAARLWSRGPRPPHTPSPPLDPPNKFARCQQIGRVDAEILAAVRQQSTSGSRARQDLSSAKHTIEELFGRVRDIQRKAEQSEVMVQEICRDIKKLDYAKKHLTSTITALRRLAMLVNAVGACWSQAGCTLTAARVLVEWGDGGITVLALGCATTTDCQQPQTSATMTSKSRRVGRQQAHRAACHHPPLPLLPSIVTADQLQLAVERHEYAEAAHLLEAVQQLSSHFQSYVHIPKVRRSRETEELFSCAFYLHLCALPPAGWQAWGSWPWGAPTAAPASCSESCKPLRCGRRRRELRSCDLTVCCPYHQVAMWSPLHPAWPGRWRRSRGG